MIFFFLILRKHSRRTLENQKGAQTGQRGAQLHIPPLATGLILSGLLYICIFQLKNSFEPSQRLIINFSIISTYSMKLLFSRSQNQLLNSYFTISIRTVFPTF